MRNKLPKTIGCQPANKMNLENTMKYSIVTVIISVMFSGCATMSGYYNLDAYNSSGELLTKNAKMTANGSNIYTVRNGMCSAFPNAVIVIRDTKTGKELSNESPYQCH